METWKAVSGYAETYEVSDLGRVRSIRDSTNSYVGRILKPASMTNGYQFVGLCQGGTTKIHSVHRLVAAAFIGPCPHKKEVNHKNGVRTDNRADNLEYMTRRENIIHGQKYLPRKHTSLRGHMLPNAKLDEHKVRAIRKRIAKGEALNLIAKDYNIVRQAIWSIAHNKTWKWVS